jgi:hypothetical protein
MTCSIHRRDEMHAEFWLAYFTRRGHSEDFGIDRRMILESSLGKEGVHRTNVAWNRDLWRAVVNMVV